MYKDDKCDLKIIQSQEHVYTTHEEIIRLCYTMYSGQMFVFSHLSAINLQSNKACVDNSLGEI